MWFFTLFIGCEETTKVSLSTDTSTEPLLQDTGLSLTDTGLEEETECDPPLYQPYPFATTVVDVNYGEGAGFGQDLMPDIVLGAPMGFGDGRGSLDVLTLGHQGSITLAFDLTIVDGEGPDFIVFENPFIGWLETGIVSVSQDGETWHTWDCDTTDVQNNFPNCAGVGFVYSHPDNCIDARSSMEAGGDAFDLADLGIESANFIRIVDSGANILGGFDLDAVVIVHGE